MTRQATMDKLVEMRMTAMADAFRIQLDDAKMQQMDFEDRFGLLVDAEYSSRKNNRLKRLIQGAGFDQPTASIVDIDYMSGRKLNRCLIQRLATCDYITACRNIFITGATGSGKSYMACAFGMEACKRYYATRYVRLPDLLLELEMSRKTAGYKKALAKYANPALLILDEWLLMKPSETEQKDILELLHRRRKRSSTIFCSQSPSFAHSTGKRSGTSSWEGMPRPSRMQSSTGLSTMDTSLTLNLWIHPRMSP